MRGRALNLSSSKCETGTVTCCSFPRVSVKRKSTNLTSFSFTIFITSATVLAAIKVLLVGWLLKNIGRDWECSFCAKAGAWRRPQSWAIVPDFWRFSLREPCTFG